MASRGTRSGKSSAQSPCHVTGDRVDAQDAVFGPFRSDGVGGGPVASPRAGAVAQVAEDLVGGRVEARSRRTGRRRRMASTPRGPEARSSQRARAAAVGGRRRRPASNGARDARGRRRTARAGPRALGGEEPGDACRFRRRRTPMPGDATITPAPYEAPCRRRRPSRAGSTVPPRAGEPRDPKSPPTRNAVTGSRRARPRARTSAQAAFRARPRRRPASDRARGVDERRSRLSERAELAEPARPRSARSTPGARASRRSGRASARRGRRARTDAGE